MTERDHLNRQELQKFFDQLSELAADGAPIVIKPGGWFAASAAAFLIAAGIF